MVELKTGLAGVEISLALRVKLLGQTIVDILVVPILQHRAFCGRF